MIYKEHIDASFCFTRRQDLIQKIVIITFEQFGRHGLGMVLNAINQRIFDTEHIVWKSVRLGF